MYAHCIHCHAPLGTNVEVEHFTVGRRLAFDESRGRLWAVCTRCARWNLSPLEERWEAIEECEKLYRATPRRFSTDQIGLARSRSGLDLIRVGRPHRPEFAAWRYGDRFGMRRRRHLARTAVGTSVAGIATVAQHVGAVVNPVVTVATVAGVFALTGVLERRRKARQAQVVAHVSAPNGVARPVTRRDLAGVDLVPGEDTRWVLTLGPTHGHRRLVDDAAFHIGALALAERNAAGASAEQVRMAVAKLEWFKGPDGLRRFALKQGGLGQLGYEQRLAVEMALHEESEQRALEGELAGLEAAWREAEQLARIADDLLLPAGVTDWLARHAPGRWGRGEGRG